MPCMAPPGAFVTDVAARPFITASSTYRCIMAPSFSEHILLVEDEAESAETLSDYLQMQGFRLLLASDGDQAIRLMDEHADQIDLAILDIMVPGRDGLDLCRYIRRHPLLADIPVIFLTAKDQEQDEIHGIDSGGDAYIAKPAGLDLIHTHVTSLLRRRKPSQGRWLNYGRVYVSVESREAWVQDSRLDLTVTEFMLLQLFFEHPRRTFTRREILEHIGEDARYVFDRTVDAHIKNLRLKLGDEGCLIKTYRGVGYGLNREAVEP